MLSRIALIHQFGSHRYAFHVWHCKRKWSGCTKNVQWAIYGEAAADSSKTRKYFARFQCLYSLQMINLKSSKRSNCSQPKICSTAVVLVVVLSSTVCNTTSTTAVILRYLLLRTSHLEVLNYSLTHNSRWIRLVASSSHITPVHPLSTPIHEIHVDEVQIRVIMLSV